MITPITHSLIRLRESAINFTFRIPTTDVLNPHPFQGQSASSPDLAGQLKQAVLQFKSQAMDKTGHQVNYRLLSETEGFRTYAHQLVPKLHKLNLNDLSDRASATAFWINLYNALVIHAVIAYDVQDSIAAGGFSGQVRFFRQAAYNIGGMRFSLEDIEHGILRANRGNPFQFSPQIPPKDRRSNFVLRPANPRIHFALNCASISCPPIGVYQPNNLDTQLALASANYILQETRLTPKGLAISKLFSWYKKDFGSNQDIAAFILKHLPEGNRKEWLENNLDSPHFSYLPYNWGLNKFREASPLL